jgi:hypothetical protein
VIVCWGQDLTEHGAVPQIAVMIECPDAPAVRSLSLRLVENTVQLIRALDPTIDPTSLAVKETRHLGLPILSVSFRTVAEKSRLPAMKLLANVELSWLAADGWLTIALTREHLEGILDAQRGLVSTLAAVPDIRATAQRGTTRTVFAAIQPDLATEVFRHWLEAHRAGELSLLDPTWWEPPDAATSALRRRGFVTEEAASLGMVVVTEVDPNGPAAGRLREGDWILGVDGVLLALSTPYADFETRWAASKSKLGPMLRVQREEQALDVVIPVPTVPAGHAPRRTEPARLVSELITLGRTLQFVSFEAHAVDEMHYSARVSVRFAPDRISNAGSSP